MVTDFQKGYKAGFIDGQNEGYMTGEAEAIQKVRDFLFETKDISEGAKDVVRKCLDSIHSED